MRVGQRRIRQCGDGILPTIDVIAPLIAGVTLLILVVLGSVGKEVVPLKLFGQMLLCLVVASSSFSARYSAAISLTLFGGLATTESVTSGFTIVAAMVPIVTLGAKGIRTMMVLYATILWPLLAVQDAAWPAEWHRFVYVLIQWGTLDLVALALGLTFAAIHRQADQRDLQRQREHQVEREQLSRRLHETAARSLTHVSFLCADLASTPDLPEPVVRDLLGICDIARSGVADLHTLMDQLQDHDHDITSSTTEAIQQECATAIRQLDEAGYRVSTEILLSDEDKRHHCALFHDVLTEAVENIVKYGNPETACSLSVEAYPPHYVLTMMNAINDDATHVEGGFGLKDMQRRLQRMGGRLETQRLEAGVPLWVLTAHIPQGDTDD